MFRSATQPSVGKLVLPLLPNTTTNFTLTQQRTVKSLLVKNG